MLAASFDLVHEGEPYGAGLVIIGIMIGEHVLNSRAARSGFSIFQWGCQLAGVAFANAIACMLMLAASFDLVHEGELYGAGLVIIGIVICDAILLPSFHRSQKPTFIAGTLSSHWSVLANAVACGVMLANLLYEGKSYAAGLVITGFMVGEAIPFAGSYCHFQQLLVWASSSEQCMRRSCELCQSFRYPPDQLLTTCRVSLHLGDSEVLGAV